MERKANISASARIFWGEMRDLRWSGKEREREMWWLRTMKELIDLMLPYLVTVFQFWHICVLIINSLSFFFLNFILF